MGAIQGIDLAGLQQKMTAISNTLDVIEVHGHTNILSMAGIMQLISDVRHEISSAMQAQYEMQLDTQKTAHKVPADR